MMLTKALAPLLIAAGLAAVAAPAFAQAQGWTFNPNAPLDVNATEQLDYNMQTCTLNLLGGVQITQDRMRLLAQTMVAHSPKSAGACRSSDINRVEANRNVFYVTPNERVRADRAVYDLKTDTLTFTGGVIVVRGENVSSSERVVINLRTNDFTLSGGVHAVLYPNRTAP